MSRIQGYFRWVGGGGRAMTIVEDGMLCLTVFRNVDMTTMTMNKSVKRFEIYTNDINKFYRLFNMCTQCLVMPICIDPENDKDGCKITIMGPCQECKNIVDNLGFQYSQERIWEKM